MPITLVMIDDHPVVLEGLEQLLNLEPDFKVIAKCSTVAAGIRAIESLRPDVVILDLRLRKEDGFGVLRHLGSRASPAVVVLTASEDPEDLLEAARLGARGVVLKAVAPRTLERCIRTVYAGGEWLTVEGENLADRLAQRKSAEAVMAQKLTSRELEVAAVAGQPSRQRGHRTTSRPQHRHGQDSRAPRLSEARLERTGGSPEIPEEKGLLRGMDGSPD